MHWIHSMVRLVPFWALSLGLLLGEIGWLMHKKHTNKRLKKFFWLISFFLLALTVAWFVGRGDINADKWVRRFYVPPV